jgi:hypothetical protein
MPSTVSIYKWLREHDEFANNYARARENQADTFADAIIDEADKAVDKDSAAAAKVKVDARKWVASKLKPKKYGDKLDMTTRAETPQVTREDMIAMMRKSPSYLAQIEEMVAEAKKPRAQHVG